MASDCHEVHDAMLQNGDGKLEPIAEAGGDCDVTFSATNEQITMTPTSREANQHRNWLRHLRTLAASLSAGLGSLSLGSVIGYTSPAIPDINELPDNYFRLNDLEISWVAGIISLGGLLGGPIGGCLADRFGRKTTILIAGAPYCLAWGLIAGSVNVYMLSVGRFLTGFCAGIIDVTVPIYISELAEASVRGFLGSTHELCTNFGYLYVFMLGCFLHWNWLAVACMAIPILMSLSLLYMPESPRWLVTHHRTGEAVSVLQWLRGADADIHGELDDIEENVLQSSEHRATWRDFALPTFYKNLQQKHKQDKPHKQPSLQHWDDEHYGPKSKMEHHNVKDVQKHAPLTVSHHEAKMQANLGHTNKKQLDRAGNSKSDMKLQDLAAEDLVHHKSQSHKSHNGRDNHSPHSAVESGSSSRTQHKVAHVKNAASGTNNNRHATLTGNAMGDRKDKKAPKKVILNKAKKAKRTKRLHKQYIF